MSSPEPPGTASRPSLLQSMQVYLLLWGIGLGTLLVLYMVLAINVMFAHLFLAATLGGVLIFLGGTRAALPLYFLTTFGTTISLGGLPVSLNRAAAALLLASVIVEFPRVPLRWFWSAASLIFMAFQVYYLTAAAILKPPASSYPVESLFYLFTTIIITMRYWDVGWMRTLLKGFSACAVLMVIVPGTLEAITGRDLTLAGFQPVLHRLDGFSVNAIVYSFTALWMIPLIATLMAESRSIFMRFVYGGGIAWLTILALLTQNRQTPFILAAMFLVYVALLRSWMRYPLVVLLGVGMLVAAPVVGTKILSRLSDVRNVSSDISLSFRHDKVNIAWEMLEEHWWFGVGHNYYKDLWKQYKPEGDMVIIQYVAAREHYIDMGYMQILTEYGAVGATIVAFMFLATLVLLFRYYRISRRLPESWYTNMLAACAALFTQLLVSLLVQDNLVIPRTYFLFGILFATCLAIDLRVRALREESAAAAIPAPTSPAP